MGSDQRLQWLLRVLCVAGIGVAGYLTWTHLAGAEPYCGGSYSCADVQNSRYSEIAGIPVAVIGLAGYVVILALSLLRGRVNTEVDFYLPVLGFGAALIGVLYSAYLTYLEAFVIFGMVLLVRGLGGDHWRDMGLVYRRSAQDLGRRLNLAPGIVALAKTASVHERSVVKRLKEETDTHGGARTICC